MTTESKPGAIRVQLVHALPDRYWSLDLSLAAGSCVGDALRAAAADIAAAGIEVDESFLAVFGRSAATGTRLHDGDRIELLRPLLVNPRDARASRASSARRGGDKRG
jgi:putative ubiquitin-RnfH superfamily antitoxin RatB of RatAB toxin-antitoxin module